MGRRSGFRLIAVEASLPLVGYNGQGVEQNLQTVGPTP